MKVAKVIAVGLVLLGLSVVRTSAQGIAGGVEAGVNLSRVSPDAAGQSISFSPGFLAGAWINIPFVTLASLQIEGLYVQKNTALGGATDLKLDYIEIPVLAKLKLFKGIYMLEGIGIGIPVRARVQPSSGAERDISSQVTTPDVGLIIAGDVPVSGGAAIELRYDGGFRNVNATAGATQRNRSWSLLARVHF
jgi:hypothetical protein